MRTLIFFCSLLLVFSVLSCTNQQENSVLPLAPEAYSSSNGYSEDCQSNLISIANAVVLYFDASGFYPASLEELGAPYSGLTCPQCAELYLLETDHLNYTVSCPVSSSIPHGSVHNSVASWAPDAERICQANMRAMSSQCVFFFAENGRYPENLEELEMADFVCPVCGDQYTYYPYGECSFFLGCGLPVGLNHGYINDGVASWIPGGSNPQNACRANMRTIASQCVIFFASNERYPESLEELGMADVVCPQCGNPYIYEGTENSCYIECGLPLNPNHGKIDNGVPSW